MFCSLQFLPAFYVFETKQNKVMLMVSLLTKILDYAGKIMQLLFDIHSLFYSVSNRTVKSKLLALQNYSLQFLPAFL